MNKSISLTKEGVISLQSGDIMYASELGSMPIGKWEVKKDSRDCGSIPIFPKLQLKSLDSNDEEQESFYAELSKKGNLIRSDNGQTLLGASDDLCIVVERKESNPPKLNKKNEVVEDDSHHVYLHDLNDNLS